MRPRVLALALLCLIASTAQPVHADASTADLIPTPPLAWQLDDLRSGPRTAADIYGPNGGNAGGFVDAFEKTWKQPGQGLSEILEHFSSVFWAAYHFGHDEGASKKNPKHNSFRTFGGLGQGAYEATDPPNLQGVALDTVVFYQGDYVAAIAVARINGTPDHDSLMGQARTQSVAIPVPNAEYNSVSSTMGRIVLIAVGVLVIAALAVGVIVLAVVLRSRRTQTVAGGVTYSPDGQYWWDGTAWRPVQPPPAPPPVEPG